MSESVNCEEQREEPTELEEAGGAEVGRSKTFIVLFPRCVVKSVIGLPHNCLALPYPDVHHSVSISLNSKLGFTLNMFWLAGNSLFMLVGKLRLALAVS